MKVIVISDSHGNIANLKHVMGFAKNIKAGAVIHCGDWDNVVAVETVASYKIPPYSVLGNADIDPKIAKIFNRTYLELKLDGRRVGVVHKVQDAVFNNQDIIFCGHTHKQEKKDKVVNPGALEHSINFVIYDTETNKVEFINE